jgi:hypothetical protein
MDYEQPFEPAVSELLATGSVMKCAKFWRTFVRSSWVMQWIDYGYPLVWLDGAPACIEFKNNLSAVQHDVFVPGAVSEILNFEGESGATLNPTVCSMFELLRILRSSRGATNERNSEPSDSMPSLRNFTRSWNGVFP